MSSNSRSSEDLKAAANKQQQKKTEEIVYKELPYHFEKELIQNQNKHVHVSEDFVPIPKVHPLERKFYARHEQQLPPFQKYVELTQCRQSHRRDANENPLLESQVYGWWPVVDARRCTSMLCELNFICAPKQRCSMTVFGEKVISERITERPAFNGLRFFLR